MEKSTESPTPYAAAKEDLAQWLAACGRGEVRPHPVWTAMLAGQMTLMTEVLRREDS